MTNAPTKEDFYAHPDAGHSRRLVFLRSLVIGEPVLVTEGITRAQTMRGRRGSLQSASKKEKMAIKTLIRGDELWVMRVA